MEKKEWWISHQHPKLHAELGMHMYFWMLPRCFGTILVLFASQKWKALKTLAFLRYVPYSGVPRWQGAKCCQAAVHRYQQIPYLFIIDLDSWGGRRFHHCCGDSPYGDSLHPRHPPPKRPVSFRQFHRVFCASNICTLQWTSDPSFCKVVILTAMKDVLQTRLSSWFVEDFKNAPGCSSGSCKKKSTKSSIEKGWLFLTTL